MLLRRVFLRWNVNGDNLKIVRFNNSMPLCQFLLDFENY